MEHNRWNTLHMSQDEVELDIYEGIPDLKKNTPNRKHSNKKSKQMGLSKNYFQQKYAHLVAGNVYYSSKMSICKVRQMYWRYVKVNISNKVRIQTEGLLWASKFVININLKVAFIVETLLQLVLKVIAIVCHWWSEKRNGLLEETLYRYDKNWCWIFGGKTKLTSLYVKTSIVCLLQVCAEAPCLVKEASISLCNEWMKEWFTLIVKIVGLKLYYSKCDRWVHMCCISLLL